MAGSREESDGGPRSLRALVVGVGLAQLFAWGVIYYPVSVTAKLVAADVGISQEMAFAGFSLLLVSGALVAPWAGRAIDRFGGRLVLSLGAIVGAASLALASSATGPVSYFISCMALGAASAVTLYDAAFAALVQASGAQGRRAITYVTFFGGFASTVFWPITAWMCDLWGWRATYLAYAAGMIVVCLPIYLLTLRGAADPDAVRDPASPAAPAPEQPLEGPARKRAFVFFATSIAAHQLVIAGLSIHLIGAVQQAGLTLQQAIMVGMAFGPAQVLGRLAEMIWGARFPAVVCGRISVVLLPLALLFLLSGSMSFSLALLFSAGCGMSNGLMTIARGTVALALFGRTGYGAIVGDLALASLFARAVGPIALAYTLGHWGLPATALASLVSALAAVFAMEIVARIDRRHRQEEIAVEA